MFLGSLLPYQVDDVDKMVDLQTVLVAYEMGLGKTPMTICAIERLREAGKVKKTVLVFCLSSLKYQWAGEIEKFSDSTVLVIDGTPDQRAKQFAVAANYDYVIMNYEQAVSEFKKIWDKVPYDAIVCDEVTAIKGFRAQRARKVKTLARRARTRFGLTGTPVENGTPEEVYSIMEFVKRSWFDGGYEDFDERYVVRNGFGAVIHYKRLPEMHKLLSAWMIRKTQLDEDVRDHLPERLPRDPVLVKADTATKKLYNHIASDLLERLKEAQELLGPTFSVAEHYGEEDIFDPVANEIKGQLMSRVSALRMLACHPQLLLDSAQKFADGDGAGSAYAHGLYEAGMLSATKAPKLDLSIKYLAEHLDVDPSYKAVVFSSYLGGVDHVVKALEAKGYRTVSYTGELTPKQKEARKVAFQTDQSIRVLVSSDAGGYGVNLPQANLLLNYDQPWTSGMRLQRNSRIIRASSEWKSVVVQDVLLQGSLEERQYAMLNQKGAVSSAILDGSGVNSAGGVDLTVGSLIGFLHTRKM